MKEQVYNSIFKSWIPPSQPILASPPPPPYGLHPTLKWKKMPIPLKDIFENQKVPPHSLAGKDTIAFLLYCWKTTLTLMPDQTLLTPITMEPVFWSHNLLLRITQVSTFQKLTYCKMYLWNPKDYHHFPRNISMLRNCLQRRVPLKASSINVSIDNDSGNDSELKLIDNILNDELQQHWVIKTFYSSWVVKISC